VLVEDGCVNFIPNKLLKTPPPDHTLLNPSGVVIANEPLSCILKRDVSLSKDDQTLPLEIGLSCSTRNI
jgi:hypothetical protein